MLKQKIKQFSRQLIIAIGGIIVSASSLFAAEVMPGKVFFFEANGYADASAKIKVKFYKSNTGDTGYHEMTSTGNGSLYYITIPDAEYNFNGLDMQRLNPDNNNECWNQMLGVEVGNYLMRFNGSNWDNNSGALWDNYSDYTSWGNLKIYGDVIDGGWSGGETMSNAYSGKGVYTYTTKALSGDKYFRINIGSINIGSVSSDIEITPIASESNESNDGAWISIGSSGAYKITAPGSGSYIYTITLDLTKSKIYVTYQEDSSSTTPETPTEETYSEIKIFGGLDMDEWSESNGKTLSDDDGDGVYEYTFTYGGSSNKFFAYYVQKNSGWIFLVPTEENITISADPVAYNEADVRNDYAWTYDFQANTKYIVRLDTKNKTVAISPVSAEETSSVMIYGGAPSNAITTSGSEMYYDNETGLYYYDFLGQNGTGTVWTYFSIDGVIYRTGTTSHVQLSEDTWTEMSNTIVDNQTTEFQFTVNSGYNYTVYINAAEKQIKYVKTQDPNAIIGIPVYPNGVADEDALKAYDFEANPVYYLCSPVLNDNRISPEWQMTKGSDGKYHINGFAMRPTNACRSTNETEEGYVYVATYGSYDQQDATILGKTTFDTNEDNPYAEGRLYNVTFDPATESLSFELVEDEMPFISMVGYNFQQNEEYTTPRNSTTSRGWQEAWILYDNNGKIVKDREGNVLYNTMWPPKNQIFFNAVKDEENIELTSKNLTFTTDYVEKTGAEWKTELQENGSQYNTLNLDDKRTYRRYVIENMWILGATKIWTGWGGQTANWGSQWNNHVNWGYGDEENNESGTTIDANATIDLTIDKKNFLFETPTYFRTVEFFYDADNKGEASKFFTTLSYGEASIQAKATTNYAGSYLMKANNVPEGATIVAYTVNRYEAVTGVNIGTVIQRTDLNLTQDDFNNIGWLEEGTLSNGKYYYSLEIQFSDNNGTYTEVVESNPFTIYQTTYESTVSAYQLLQLSDEGKNALNTETDFITYNPAGFGALYLVSVDGSYTELTGNDLTNAWSALEDNANYDWSTNVWLQSEIPSDYVDDAQNTTETGISLEGITDYNLFVNGAENSILPQSDKSFSYVYDAETIGQTNIYGLTMDYTQTVGEETKALTSAGGNANLKLIAPQAENVTENEVVFSVEKITADGQTTTIKNVEGEAEITNYYSLSATFNFAAPNINSEIENAYDVVYVPTIKITDAEGNITTKTLDPTTQTSVTINNVDPTAQSIEFTVETRYYANGTTDFNAEYTVGTFGNGVNITTKLSALGNTTEPVVSASVDIYVNGEDKTKYDISVNKASASSEENSLAGTEMSNDYYDFDIEDTEGDQVAGLQNGNETDLGKVMEGVDQPESVTVTATPIYVFKVGDEENTEFVGLRGTTGKTTVNKDTYTGISSIDNGNLSVATGNGFIEICGADDAKIYDITGAFIASGCNRHNVTAGVYVVVANQKTMKIIVR